MHVGDVIQGEGIYLLCLNRQIEYTIEVHRPNTDSAIAALYILLDSSEDAFCSV